MRRGEMESRESVVGVVTIVTIETVCGGVTDRATHFEGGIYIRRPVERRS